MVIAFELVILSYYENATITNVFLFKAIDIYYLMFTALDLTIEFYIKSLQ